METTSTLGYGARIAATLRKDQFSFSRDSFFAPFVPFCGYSRLIWAEALGYSV
jgi:hypothetical protein